MKDYCVIYGDLCADRARLEDRLVETLGARDGLGGECATVAG